MDKFSEHTQKKVSNVSRTYNLKYFIILVYVQVKQVECR